MSFSMPNLKAGKNILRLDSWKVTAVGEYQIKHTSSAGNFRPVYRTFKAQNELGNYFEAITGCRNETPTEREIQSLMNTEILCNLRVGKNGFMNITRVLEVVSQPLVLKGSFPVIESKSAASVEASQCEERSPHVGQIAHELP